MKDIEYIRCEAIKAASAFAVSGSRRYSADEVITVAMMFAKYIQTGERK